VRFEQADVYALPYPDGGFDLVFSHALTSHLREPARALAAMRRMLKPGGLATVVENDPGTFVIAPAGSAMELFIGLFGRVQHHNGGRRLAARHLRGALLEAGFTRVEAHAAGEGFGTPERARAFALNAATVAGSADFVATVLSEGWATQAELDGLPPDLLAWAEQPDAFLGVLKIGALGWVGDP
jgi:hypothetical protein